MARRGDQGSGQLGRGAIALISLAVFVSARAAWWLDRTPAVDEAFGGETEHVALRWLAGTASSLGSFDLRVVVLAIVLTGLMVTRRFVDAGYVVAVIIVVHVAERILKGTEERRRPVDPEAGYFLPDVARLTIMVFAILGALLWWRFRGGSGWRVAWVAALAAVLQSIGWLVRLIDVPARTDAFPSGHAANTMALGAVILVTTRTPNRLRAAIAIATIVVVIGWSRIALGYHHPTDVVAGWSLALVIAVALDMGRRTIATRSSPDGPDRTRPGATPPSEGVSGTRLAGR